MNMAFGEMYSAILKGYPDVLSVEEMCRILSIRLSSDKREQG